MQYSCMAIGTQTYSTVAWPLGTKHTVQLRGYWDPNIQYSCVAIGTQTNSTVAWPLGPKHTVQLHGHWDPNIQYSCMANLILKNHWDPNIQYSCMASSKKSLGPKHTVQLHGSTRSVAKASRLFSVLKLIGTFWDPGDTKASMIKT